MEELTAIRRRLMQKEKKKRSKILSFFEFLLIVIALLLGFLIYARNDEDGKLFSSFLKIDVSFKKMNEDIDFALAKMISNFNIFKDTNNNQEEMVDIIYSYQKEDKNYYQTSDHLIPMLKDGQILKIEENEDDYNITLKYQGKILACYYEIKDIYVKTGDILSKGDILGSYDEHFKVLFTQDGTSLDYEEVLLS